MNKISRRLSAHPVSFVVDQNRSIIFHMNMLGFEKRWHSGNGAGNLLNPSLTVLGAARASQLARARRERESPGGVASPFPGPAFGRPETATRYVGTCYTARRR